MPDERDGRAGRLVVTDVGHAAFGSLRAEREAVLARVTADWDDAELATFTDLFGRLLDGLTAVLPVNAGRFTHRQIVTTIVGLVVATFLAALDQTVVSTAIRTITDDPQGCGLQAWATTAFLITSTITTPL